MDYERSFSYRKRLYMVVLLTITGLLLLAAISQLPATQRSSYPVTVTVTRSSTR